MSRASLLKAAVIVAAAAMAACAANGEEKAGGKSKAKAAADSKKERLVSVMTIEPRTFRQMITLVGAIKPDRDVTIASEAPGRVVRIGFEKGDDVTAGQPLVWLDDSEIKAAIAAAEAERALAELDYTKLSALAERRAGVSEFSLDQARLKLAAAEARLDSLRVQRGKMTIKAPFGGVIASRPVEQGAMVSPGQPLARLISIKPVKLVTGAPETAISDFSLGKRAVIRFDAFPEREYRGAVTYIASEIDQMTRVFDMEIELANADMKILPEMSAKVTFTRKEIKDAIAVPQEAVLELPGGHAVFVVDDGGAAKQKMVTIKNMAEGMALIGSGLRAGETLVISGQRGLIDGDMVKIAGAGSEG